MLIRLTIWLKATPVTSRTGGPNDRTDSAEREKKGAAYLVESWMARCHWWPGRVWSFSSVLLGPRVGEEGVAGVRCGRAGVGRDFTHCRSDGCAPRAAAASYRSFSPQTSRSRNPRQLNNVNQVNGFQKLIHRNISSSVFLKCTL